MLKDFKCKRCGECCRTPRLFKKDIERIKESGYKEEDFVYIDDLGNKYIKDKDGWCMFLKRGKIVACKIYEARAEICRMYPTELHNGSCKPVELAFDKYLEERRK